MPVETLTNAYALVNAVDLSARVKSVTVNYSKELHIATAMGDTGQRRVVGLADWSMDFEFYRDEDTSQTIQTLWGIVGSQVAMKVKAKNTTKAATNAEYQGNGMLEALPVVDADVTGGAATFTARWVGSDGVALVRST